MGNYSTHRNTNQDSSLSSDAQNAESGIESSSDAGSTTNESQITTPTSPTSPTSPNNTRRRPRRLIFIYDFELPTGRNRVSNDSNNDNTSETEATIENTSVNASGQEVDELYLGDLFNEEQTQQQQQETENLLTTETESTLNALAEEINSELNSINIDAEINSDDLPPLEEESTVTGTTESNSTPTNTNTNPPTRTGAPRMRVWIEVSPSSIGLSNLLLGESDSNPTDSQSSSSTAPRQVTGHVIFVQVLPAGYTDPVSPEDDLQEFLNHTFQLHAAQRGGNPPASQKAMDELESVSNPSSFKDTQPQCTICFCEFEDPSSNSCNDCKYDVVNNTEITVQNCIKDQQGDTVYMEEQTKQQPLLLDAQKEPEQDNDKGGEEVVKIECGHIFHRGCIQNWLKEHNTCPLCRWELPTEDLEYEKDRVKRMQERRASERETVNVKNHIIDNNNTTTVINNATTNINAVDASADGDS